MGRGGEESRDRERKRDIHREGKTKENTNIKGKIKIDGHREGKTNVKTNIKGKGRGEC